MRRSYFVQLFHFFSFSLFLRWPQFSYRLHSLFCVGVVFSTLSVRCVLGFSFLIIKVHCVLIFGCFYHLFSVKENKTFGKKLYTCIFPPKLNATAHNSIYFNMFVFIFSFLARRPIPVDRFILFSDFSRLSSFFLYSCRETHSFSYWNINKHSRGIPNWIKNTLGNMIPLTRGDGTPPFSCRWSKHKIYLAEDAPSRAWWLSGCPAWPADTGRVNTLLSSLVPTLPRRCSRDTCLPVGVTCSSVSLAGVLRRSRGSYRHLPDSCRWGSTVFIYRGSFLRSRWYFDRAYTPWKSNTNEKCGIWE